MKRLTIFLMAFFILVSVQFSSSAGSEICLSPKDSLKGVESFSVLVEGLSESAKSIGLSEQLIQSKVELQLRKNGLPVVDEEAKLDNHGEPGDGGEYLYVNITLVRLVDFGFFAYAINV